MRTIFKFPVPITDHFSVPMPKGAKVLCVQMQRDAVVLWAEVDSLADEVARHFCVFGTGSRMPSREDAYVGTVQDGGLVWHIYEKA